MFLHPDLDGLIEICMNRIGNCYDNMVIDMITVTLKTQCEVAFFSTGHLLTLPSLSI
jgi:hypothetical protein